MDGFNGYNHIKMHLVDAEQTAFKTSIGNFHYTYQRAVTAIFHDMLHQIA